MTNNAGDGLQIVLSPMQLSAILERQTIDRGATLSNRFWGALTVVGGAIELVGSAALWAAPDPTLLTKAGGTALGLHGADTLSTGLTQFWTGRPKTTLTEQAAVAAARNLGIDPTVAVAISMGVDIAVSGGPRSAARIAQVRQGIAMLEASEGVRVGRSVGHTIEKHIGKTEAELRNRLVGTRMEAASTFNTLDQAGLAVSKALKANEARIKQWALTSHAGERLANPPLIYDVGEIIGSGVVRITGQLQDMTKVQIILKKTGDPKQIYFILTAHPIL
ncbi:MAG: hypothetical protein LBV61_09825 [Burkholderiaceae bacterium]|jgi:hypothetical protein|nr:hypothetical protein [Burkholderiaceae bacterium]